LARKQREDKINAKNYQVRGEASETTNKIEGDKHSDADTTRPRGDRCTSED
jgi:hypothetical protein